MATTQPASFAQQALGLILWARPLLFAFGFLVPLLRTVIERAGWTAPLGLSSLSFALLVGGGWGLLAQLRGRWI